MSQTYKDEKPKLKSNRFNKFQPSSTSKLPQIEDKEVSPKQSYKRTNNDKNIGNSSLKQKKIYDSNYNMPCTTKNLANNRLKKLKEEIQNDLKLRNMNNHSCSVPSDKSVGRPLNKYDSSGSLVESTDANNVLQNVQEKIFNKCDVSPSRNLPECEINKSVYHSFSSPNQLLKKNLANERLHNIKKKLNTDDSTTLSPNSVKAEDAEVKTNTRAKTSTSESPRSIMEITENRTMCGLKRNISNITNTYDYDIFDTNPKRLHVEQCVTSTPVSISNSYTEVQLSGNTDKSLNSGVKEQSFVNTSKSNSRTKSSTNVSYGTPVSRRLLNINNNFSENSSSILNAKLTSEPTSASQVSHIKKNNNFYEDVDNSGSKFKSPTDSQVSQRLFNNQKNSSNTSTSLESHNDNFFTKMAMTATWIRNHQDLTNTDNGIDNSLMNASENSINNITDENSNQANFDQETEDMEWTNAEPDEEIVVTKRSNVENIEENTAVKKDPEKLKDVCIIVDTNVFIHGLSKIKDIINLKTTGSFEPLIYIPWMVITELDYMKDSCSDVKLKKNVINSIKFINGTLKENSPRVIGQTIFEVDKQKHVGPNPDDKIISCCLQVAEKYETVILLSNDINLKNKAMIHNLTACSTNEVMVKIMTKLARNTKSQKIMHKMGIMCSRIICECAKAAYGDIWMKMDMLSHAPWSLVECIKRFKKYWESVFKDMLMKQFTKTLDKLYNLLQISRYICDDSEEFIEFMKLCVTLCIFLKDIEECRGFVENTINDITKIG